MSRNDTMAVLGVAGLCLIVILAGVLCVSALAGCGPMDSSQRSATLRMTSAARASSEQTSAVADTSTASASASSDMEAVDKELDAMQKELDDLGMPADSDFDNAADALF